MKNRIIATIVGAAALASFTAMAPEAEAVTADPVPVITCDSLVIHLGETLHCTVSNTAGYTPTDKITYTNPRTGSTINVANLAGQTFDVHYTPSLGDVGRTERLISTIYQNASGHLVRPSSGYVFFDVVAATATVAPAVVSEWVHSPCHAYLLGPTFAPNGGVAYCDGGGAVAGDHLRVKVRCQGDATGVYRYGPAVYVDNNSSALYCPTGRLALGAYLALYAG